MFDLNGKKKKKNFTGLGLIIWSYFILFPCRNKHFRKPETTSGFRLVLAKQSMLFLNGTTFYVPFACFDFFSSFSQIQNILIINIPHNSETTQLVEIQEVSQSNT